MGYAAPGRAHGLGAGTLFASFTDMQFVCRHCDEIFEDDAYRVTSVDNDVVLLNMIVCSRCALVARDLKLSTQKIDLTSVRDARAG
jgi:hypothetical protein